MTGLLADLTDPDALARFDALFGPHRTGGVRPDLPALTGLLAEVTEYLDERVRLRAWTADGFHVSSLPGMLEDRMLLSRERAPSETLRHERLGLTVMLPMFSADFMYSDNDQFTPSGTVEVKTHLDRTSMLRTVLHALADLPATGPVAYADFLTRQTALVALTPSEDERFELRVDEGKRTIALSLSRPSLLALAGMLYLPEHQELFNTRS